MANYSALKTAINASIKQNGQQQITGAILNSVLTAMVDNLGDGYRYHGVVTPSSAAITTDNKIWVLALTPGTYTNFGDLVVGANEYALLVFDTAWSKVAIPFQSLANYYTKSQTYSQGEVNALLDALKNGLFVSVNTLPTASADTLNKIYLVPKASAGQQNVKDEYITIDNGAEAATRYTWEKIGSTEISLDGVVRYDQSQSLTTEQKSQARGNIWAASAEDVPVIITTENSFYDITAILEDSHIPQLWHNHIIYNYVGDVGEGDGYLFTANLLNNGQLDYKICSSDGSWSGDTLNLLPNPDNGSAGQVLTKTANGEAWQTPAVSPSDITAAIGTHNTANNAHSALFSGKADKTTSSVKEYQSGATYTLVANEIATLNASTAQSGDSISIALPASPAVTDCFDIQITLGANVPTINFPEGIKWLGGSAPSFSANKTYEVNVMNGLWVCGEF